MRAYLTIVRTLRDKLTSLGLTGCLHCCAQLASMSKWGVAAVNKVLERLGGLAHVHAANRLLRLMVALGRWVRVG